MRSGDDGCGAAWIANLQPLFHEVQEFNSKERRIVFNQHPKLNLKVSTQVLYEIVIVALAFGHGNLVCPHGGWIWWMG